MQLLAHSLGTLAWNSAAMLWGSPKQPWRRDTCKGPSWGASHQWAWTPECELRRQQGAPAFQQRLDTVAQPWAPPSAWPTELVSTPRGLLYATTLYGGLFLATVAETGVLEIPSPQELPLPFCVGCSEREFEGQRRPIAEPHSLLLIYSQFPRASPGSRCSAYFPPSPNSHLGLNLGFPPSLSVGLLFPLAALILSPGVWSPLDRSRS